MGYRSAIEGEITFSRPLNRREAAPLAEIMKDPWNVYELVTEMEERDTDEGTLTIHSTEGVRSMGDGFKAYEWESILRRLIDALPDGVTASGYLQRDGEETGDMERLYVRGCVVTSVKPRIIWDVPA